MRHETPDSIAEFEVPATGEERIAELRENIAATDLHTAREIADFEAELAALTSPDRYAPLANELLREALQALKDIVNAADNGQAYTAEELQGFALDILNKAYEAGIRLDGEE
jgi:aryl-alcohol dehydrogenase-like predicted oxidoreductase